MATVTSAVAAATHTTSLSSSGSGGGVGSSGPSSYHYNHSQQQQQQYLHFPRPSSALSAAFDRDYDYRAGAAVVQAAAASVKAEIMNSNSHYNTHNGTPSAGAAGSSVNSKNQEESMDGDEALLDLAQLEELHQEAEKMKALGNKHMAAQEYTRAYNAYSAALQLSPVGPSSHVFLSNRAAALLSLKRYHAAATDARRAVALAPTFGKAHARLGQALYFLKDYAGAVAAYEDALLYEPENQVTRTYLEKAKKKLEKREVGGHSIAGDASVMDKMSIATDPQHNANVVSTGYRTHTAVLKAAAAASSSSQTKTISHSDNKASTLAARTPTSPPARGVTSVATAASPSVTASSAFTNQNSPDFPQDDPDFDEALKIQLRANRYLAQKQYKAAIEEYTAALFLVPDDPYLSPDLHLGRAHALNGSRRHERAKNDAQLAIKINPSPAAYSTLAKSLFYLRDYRGAVEAFNDCIRLLPSGEALGMFDKAYLDKAQAALEEEDASLRKAGMVGGGQTVSSSDSVVPKLPPPRFVPREKAIQSTPNLPPMPKEWPQQSPAAVAFKCGPERDVVFLSESLGIKLNRGADGIVRVLYVAPNPPGSPVARTGNIFSGDVVREAAGVDIRRPITNVMWGDTIALIKMAPRPIRLVVAKELSPVPHTFLEEQRKAEQLANAEYKVGAQLRPAVASLKLNHRALRPSNASGDEPVVPSAATAEINLLDDEISHDDSEHDDSPAEEFEPVLGHTLEDSSDFETKIYERSSPKAVDEVSVDSSPLPIEDKVRALENELGLDIETKLENSMDFDTKLPVELRNDLNLEIHKEEKNGDPDIVDVSLSSPAVTPARAERPGSLMIGESKSEVTILRDQEEDMIGGEVMFERDSRASYAGWDNLRWLSYSGIRKIRFRQPCFRLFQSEQKNLFWSKTDHVYDPRLLVIYDEPNIILILRRCVDPEEMREILDLPAGAEMDTETVDDMFWLVESVIEPASAKLRLSTLTTATSLPPDKADDRRKTCFEIITPVESILLSSAKLRSEFKMRERSFSDNVAFLETAGAEAALTRALCSAHDQRNDIGEVGVDISWKHRLILGTLHSHVVARNIKEVELAIKAAKARTDPSQIVEGRPLPVIDDLDDNGLPPLFYACAHRIHMAVALLVNAGANVRTFRVDTNGLSFAHICARNLDDTSLSLILSAYTKPSPNALDFSSRTPMYLATTEGKTVTGASDPNALGRCIKALEVWGGQMIIADSLRFLPHPVAVLCEQWRPEEVAVILDHSIAHYHLENFNGSKTSLNAHFHYPVHRALAFLRLNAFTPLPNDEWLPESRCVQVLRLLFERGFEPNERIEVNDDDMDLSDYFGYTPLQVLASVALDARKRKDRTDEWDFKRIESLILEAAEFLIRHGARLDVEAPPARRLRRGVSADSLGSSESERQASAKTLSNLRSILDSGDGRLTEAEAEWKQFDYVDATENVDIKDNNADLPDTNTPGGNNEKSCAICWKVFGTLMNRKHKCRLTLRYVCDDCSTKRFKWQGRDVRISDGTFLAGRVEAAKQKIAVADAAAKRDLVQEVRSQKEREEEKRRKEEEEQARRPSLFGNLIERFSSFADEEAGTEPARPNQMMEGISATLNETRNALLDRGEKLDTLNDKSAALVDTSSNFAKMAKELRQKSERQGLFW